MDRVDMLVAERSTFDRIKNTLPAGQVVVIKGEQLVGAYASDEEAITEGARQFGLGSFLVRRVGSPAEPVSIPALTLGILRASPPRPVSG